MLFNLKCLVVVVDAGCCTRNYVEYDETRWTRERKPTFSAQLRTLDALLGDDARIVEQTAAISCELGVSCAALVGTPVPALVGMDLAGMAREAEATSGVPTIGVATSGFETYETGVAAALEALIDRFAVDKGTGSRAQDGTRGARRISGQPAVNVLGATPQDFMTASALASLEQGLRAAGLDIAFSTASPFGVDDVEAAPSADASIVVSTAGLSAARRLRDACGVPVVVGRPYADDGCKQLTQLVAAVRDAAARGERPRERTLWEGSSGRCAKAAVAARVLLVGDQVAMNSLRSQLRAAFATAGSPREIAVASFFAWEDAWAEPGDVRLTGEEALEEWAREHPGAAYVGDPVLRRIPGIEGARFAELPHEAVSSTLFQHAPSCVDDRAALREVEAALADA